VRLTLDDIIVGRNTALGATIHATDPATQANG
jgi:hypothetical protein